MSSDTELAKRRLITMLMVDSLCMLIAIGAAVGWFMFGIDWLQWVFGAAILVGFGAQIWFVAALRRRDEGA